MPKLTAITRLPEEAPENGGPTSINHTPLSAYSEEKLRTPPLIWDTHWWELWLFEAPGDRFLELRHCQMCERPWRDGTAQIDLVPDDPCIDQAVAVLWPDIPWTDARGAYHA